MAVEGEGEAKSASSTSTSTRSTSAGVYANFANISFSDYEFTITFARIDHEVEEGDIPGVVVSRVNMSTRFMKELHRRDAGLVVEVVGPRGDQEPAGGDRRNPDSAPRSPRLGPSRSAASASGGRRRRGTAPSAGPGRRGPRREPLEQRLHRPRIARRLERHPVGLGLHVPRDRGLQRRRQRGRRRRRRAARAGSPPARRIPPRRLATTAIRYASGRVKSAYQAIALDEVVPAPGGRTRGR